MNNQKENELWDSELFKKRFSTLVNESGKTTRELAAEIKVSDPLISLWKTGKRTPNIGNVISIANYFNVSVDWLLGLEDEDNRSKTLNVRAAVEYTGLTEEAIKRLRRVRLHPLYRKPMDEPFITKNRAYWVSHIIEDGSFEEISNCLAFFYECSYWMAKKRIELTSELEEAKRNGKLCETVYYKHSPKTIKQNGKFMTVSFNDFQRYTDEYMAFMEWFSSFPDIDSIANEILEQKVDSEPCDIQQIKIQKIVSKELDYANRIATEDYLNCAEVINQNGTDNKENR